MRQALRDEFQSSHLVNCCVWPYESGEVIVQSYNTLLTLSHLVRSACSLPGSYASWLGCAQQCLPLSAPQH